MSSIRLSGSTSGYYDLTVPAAAGTNSIDLSNLAVKDSSGNLDITGKLGIGTTTGSESLTTTGNIRFQTNNKVKLEYLNSSGAYVTGTTGGAAVGFEYLSGGADHEIFFETHNGGVSHREVMRIDKDGYVRKPYQVAFSAYQTASYNTAANATLTWSATHVNRGNCFNTSNGTFTAPVAGAYCFQFYQLTANNTTSGDVRININGAVVDGHYGYGGNFQGHKQATLSCVLQLSANDAVKITSLGSNNWNDRHGGFSGFLIG